jgi:hypothetical protein
LLTLDRSQKSSIAVLLRVVSRPVDRGGEDRWGPGHHVARVAFEGRAFGRRCSQSVLSARRAARLPGARHPFGYGKERSFWSMLAAVGIFVTGGCFSFCQGLRTLLDRGSGRERFGVAFAVLAVSFRAEGASLARAALQARRDGQAHARGLVAELRHGTNPAMRTVFAADAHEFLQTQPEIDTVLAVLTMRLGPDSALLAARADLADGLDSDEVGAVSGRIKAALTARFPVFDQVFIDITDATAADRARAAANLALLASSVRGEER